MRAGLLTGDGGHGKIDERLNKRVVYDDVCR
jgi:hypothetical protein